MNTIDPEYKKLFFYAVLILVTLLSVKIGLWLFM